MNRTDANVQIALALGFKPRYYTSNGRKIGCWDYPTAFRMLYRSEPSHDLPDFVGLIERAAAFVCSGVGVSLTQDRAQAFVDLADIQGVDDIASVDPVRPIIGGESSL